MAYESVGRKFESCRAHHKNIGSTAFFAVDPFLFPVHFRSISGPSENFPCCNWENRLAEKILGLDPNNMAGISIDPDEKILPDLKALTPF